MLWWPVTIAQAQPTVHSVPCSTGEGKTARVMPEQIVQCIRFCVFSLALTLRGDAVAPPSLGSDRWRPTHPKMLITRRPRHRRQIKLSLTAQNEWFLSISLLGYGIDHFKAARGRCIQPMMLSWPTYSVLWTHDVLFKKRFTRSSSWGEWLVGGLCRWEDGHLV